MKKIVFIVLAAMLVACTMPPAPPMASPLVSPVATQVVQVAQREIPMAEENQGGSPERRIRIAECKSLLARDPLPAMWRVAYVGCEVTMVAIHVDESLKIADWVLKVDNSTVRGVAIDELPVYAWAYDRDADTWAVLIVTPEFGGVGYEYWKSQVYSEPAKKAASTIAAEAGIHGELASVDLYECMSVRLPNGDFQQLIQSGAADHRYVTFEGQDGRVDLGQAITAGEGLNMQIVGYLVGVNLDTDQIVMIKVYPGSLECEPG